MSDVSLPVTPELLRRACAHYLTGVTAMTACAADGTIAALTINSFTVASWSPPMVLVSIGRKTASHQILLTATRCAIHVLHGRQEELAWRFATGGLGGTERLASVGWHPGAGGEPRLDDFAALFCGTIAERIDGGDHTIYRVDVDDVEIGPEGEPVLGFFRGKFFVPQQAAGPQ